MPNKPPVKPEILQFTKVKFKHFKAFEAFTLHLRHFNILVGPNNSGKSTILIAFRILAAAMRKANNRNPEIVRGPLGHVTGYKIDLAGISVAEENIFYNYEDAEPATVTFTLANRSELLLYFAERGSCCLITEVKGRQVQNTAGFKRHFNCSIGFVPILGPVEHNEPLYEREAAQRALFSYRAARNFRNIWHHYPDKFDEFRSVLLQTWPGMDIERPVIQMVNQKAMLFMFCPEERIPREIFWAGFGFQVWCQMLTHLIQARSHSIFLIDEPDIYLHSELQRQLLALLKNLGCDILIATHSLEIITEAEPDEIVLISKKERRARRVQDPSQLTNVFETLGSNLNPILTQLTKTRRVVFVEGKDFNIIGKFAGKLRQSLVANRSSFAIVPVEGFNPDRIRSLKMGMETTLGSKISVAAIFDRDYRSSAECEYVTAECKKFCNVVILHGRKEIENFLLFPEALDRAASMRLSDHARRTGGSTTYSSIAEEVLSGFALDKKSYIMAQYITDRRQFERKRGSANHESKISEDGLREFESLWSDLPSQLKLVPGKDALSFLNQSLQAQYEISITPTSIIDAMKNEEVAPEMKQLINDLSAFAAKKVTD